MNIELDTLTLVRYGEEFAQVKDELDKGDSSSSFIHQIGERLEMTRDNDSVFQSAYVVLDFDMPVGYLFISSVVRDEVFLEYAVLKEHRGKGYASDMVSETTAYLFENHNMRSVRLDIDPSNKNSILVARACGFMVDEDEYEARNFTGKMQFIKENEYYISKRR